MIALRTKYWGICLFVLQVPQELLKCFTLENIPNFSSCVEVIVNEVSGTLVREIRALQKISISCGLLWNTLSLWN